MSDVKRFKAPAVPNRGSQWDPEMVDVVLASDHDRVVADMLEALAALDGIYSDYTRDSFDLSEIRKIIREALQKARGKS